MTVDSRPGEIVACTVTRVPARASLVEVFSADAWELSAVAVDVPGPASR